MYLRDLMVQIMVKFNRVECLAHPLCLAYLAMKWY